MPEDEKTDIIPELWMGKNIIDYVDPDIEAKLLELEKEEELREQAGVYDNAESVRALFPVFFKIFICLCRIEFWIVNLQNMSLVI